jgi:hypothetical protein
MRTLHKQLSEIKSNSETIHDVINNYNMGLITMSEKHNQLLDILSIIDNIKKEICKEYGINSNAVNLMLTL